MKLSVSMAIAAATVVGACHAAEPAPAPSDMYGTWKITRINTTGVVTQGEARINALVGATLVIRESEVIEADEAPCQIVKPYPIVSFVVTADEVPKKAAPSFAATGLPAKVWMFDTGCLAIFKVGERIVFADRGAYYTAERATGLRR